MAFFFQRISKPNLDPKKFLPSTNFTLLADLCDCTYQKYDSVMEPNALEVILPFLCSSCAKSTEIKNYYHHGRQYFFT